MKKAWPVAEIRSGEQVIAKRLPPDALMFKAAAGLASICSEVLKRLYGKRVTLLVGAGNNGGDALFAGALLARRGAQVTAVLLSPERAHQGGLADFCRSGGRIHSGNFHSLIADSDLIVDGIVGIGGRGGLVGLAAEAAAASAISAAVRIAVDVPSGVDAETGVVPGNAFKADLTVTFGCYKSGLLIGQGPEYAGTVRLVDIGLAEALPASQIVALEDADVAEIVPMPRSDDHKYSRGVVGIAAGSRMYSGAAVLTVGAALRGGAGMVRYVGGAEQPVRMYSPEAVMAANVSSARVQAWTVGPGLSTDDEARDTLRQVLATDVPVLVDADGITLLAEEPQLLKGRTAPTVVTPHDKEFARLAGNLNSDRITATRKAAADLGATVLLKGNATIVAAPDGMTYVNTTGTPWLATAGSGDVLSGLIGTLMAAGVEPAQAAACGAFVHGLAAQLADPPLSAGDVLQALPAAFRWIYQSVDNVHQ